MRVIKRNGELQDFDIAKAVRAVSNAFTSLGKVMPDRYREQIAGLFEKKDIIGVEEIQDRLETFLMRNNNFKVAKAFILYREKHREARFIRERIDYMERYSSSSDNAATSSETDANANVSMKNVANLEGEVYKTTNRIIQRQRMKDKLNELFPEVARQYEEDLSHHIIYAHDESQTPVLKNYCCAVTLYPLLLEGSGNIDGVTPSAPNDIQSFSGQVTNLVFLLSSQVRGAVALGDYIIALNYYVIKEFGPLWYEKPDAAVTSEHSMNKRTIEDSIRKGMKQFIYGINQPAGNRSYNSPFSNLNFFDKYYFNALFKDFCYPDGTKPEWEAIDCLQRMFVILLRELRLKKPLTFPVTSFCCLHDNNDFLDKDYRDFIADEWSKGSSFFLYLSNNPDSISSCCRVQNELTENTFNSTIGLTGIMTGSTNVITLNLNRIIQDCDKAYGLRRNGGWKENTRFIHDYLKEILERVYKYQIAYKTMIYDMEDRGMYSSSNAGYIFTKKLYCTIGVIGYCEAAEFLGMDINYNKDYLKFLQLVFSTIKEQNQLHSIRDKKRPFIFNMEAIPGENLAVKLYKWDKEAGYKVPEDQNLYSSYFFKQWDPEISILDKLRLHGKEINKFCNGGQACHLHLDAHPSKEQFLKLMDFTVKNGVNYWTVNVPISECLDCGHVVNAPVQECPHCRSNNIDYWIRIIGFLRPVRNYSKERKEEVKRRIFSHYA